MRLETKIQMYIQENGWDIDYNGRTVTNIFGTEYNVEIGCAESYASISYVRYGSKEITIKEPCQMHLDIFGDVETIEYMSYALAHEVAHTETYGLPLGLSFFVLAWGIKKAITEKDAKYLLKGSCAAIGTKFAVEESCAELGAYLLHGASLNWEGNGKWLQSLLDLL